MLSQRAMGTLLVLALGGSVVEGFVLYNHHERLNARAYTSDLAEVEERVGFAEGELNQLEPIVDALEKEPDFDPTELQAQIEDLQARVKSLDAENGRLLTYINQVNQPPLIGALRDDEVDARDVNRPYFCYPDDPVYWDYRGLSC